MSETKTIEYIVNGTYQGGSVGTFQIDLQETYTEATNTSKIKVTAVRFKTSNLGGLAGNMSGVLNVNGLEVLSIKRNANRNGAYVDVQTYFYTINLTDPDVTVTERTIERSNDGSLSVSVTANLYGSRSGFDVTATGYGGYIIPDGTAKSVTFTTYPRASSITSISSAVTTLGELSLIVSPKKTGVKHKVSFKVGGTTLLTSDFFNTSYSLTLPRTWFNSYPNTAALSVTASVQTYNADGTTLGNPVTAAVTVTADSGMKPTVASGWASLSPYNTGSVSGFSGYIQGHSKAQAAFDTSKITHANGATLAGLSITCAGETDSTAPYLTKTLTGSATAICTVTDSRGRTASESFTITVLPYSVPAISNVSIFRCSSDGTADEDGAYFSVRGTLNISGLSGQNSGTLKTAFKIRGGSYGAETTLTSGTAAVIGTASPDSTCIVRITASDAVGGSALYEQTIPARAWAMKFRSGGMGVGFGKAPTADNVLQLPAGWSVQIGDSAMTESEIKALKAVSNPNLLDNWYFGKPVNQRGFTSGSTNNTYTIDRWKMRGTAAISIGNGGFSIPAAGFFNGICQSIENGTSSLKSKTVTLSAFISGFSGSGNAALQITNAADSGSVGTAIAAQNFNSNGLVSLTATMPTAFSNSYLNVFVAAGANENVSFNVLAVKLEFGNAQTLAHQENGVWVLNEIPDYGEQLRRCKRYFVRINGSQTYGNAFGGFVSNGIKEIVAATGIGDMRTTPSVSSAAVSGQSTTGLVIRGVNGYCTEATYSAPYSGAVITSSNNGATLTIKKSNSGDWTNLVSNTPINVSLRSLNIDLIADL